MNASKLNGRGIVVGGTVIGMLMLASCLPVPLGDPGKARVESSYVGAWEWQDGAQTNVVTIRPYDEHTYFVDAMTIAGSIEDPAPKSRSLYKAWLTKVKGETFITMQPVETLATLPTERPQPKYFIVAKLRLEEGKLKAWGVDGNFKAVKEAGTATALEQAIGENIGDGRMWTSPVAASPVRADRMEALAKLLKMFAEPAAKQP
jgi:hypothetical protein